MVAIDNAGNQGEVAHYTIDVDSTFPPHVSEVVAKIQSDSDVVLKWLAVEDAYSGTDFHRIYWRTLKGTLDSQINQDGTRSLTYGIYPAITAELSSMSCSIFTRSAP